MLLCLFPRYFAVYIMYKLDLNAKKKYAVTFTEDERVLKEVACDAVDETGPSSSTVVVSTTIYWKEQEQEEVSLSTLNAKEKLDATFTEEVMRVLRDCDVMMLTKSKNRA
jgi:uncharacterized membrane protein